LVQAERAGILQEAAAARYTFSHEVLRSVLYDSLPATKRAVLHGRVALELNRHGPETLHDYHGTIAYHLRNSAAENAQTEAATHLHRAGEEALEAGAPENAGELFHEALHLLGPAGNPRQRC